ncbi:potassium channel family protein [Citricoccus sp.]|uniref:potassium channel family protein n=1 Tax=Citricoccus sp. TaxID=1978372 RepID=UPI0028BE7BCA|nr:potassium channel family protein [Citricoccus sp.]
MAGVGVIVLGLRDMFHSLLHPEGQGSLSRLVLSGVWRISRMTGHRLGSATGPGGMVAVILMWVLLQSIGWALVYLPHVPAGFAYSGVEPARYPEFAEALYLSLTTLSTVGFGDVVAIDPWIRLAAPLQALTGFALLTAALTWFTQVYPPLMRRRALALELYHLGDARYADGVEEMNPVVVAGLMDRVSGQVEQVGIDLVQHTESYFFVEKDPDLALPRQLPRALELRNAIQHSPAPELSIGAHRLSAALDRLGDILASDFVTGENTEDVFGAYASDHRRAR